MPAAAVLATRTCTNTACIQATSHIDLCECTDCHGDNHGSAHRTSRTAVIAGLQARYVTPGFTASMLADMDDDAF